MVNGLWRGQGMKKNLYMDSIYGWKKKNLYSIAYGVAEGQNQKSVYGL
jgi:hypothetical protein